MYYLATPTTKELFSEKNIFQDPIKEKLKNKSPLSERDICGPKCSFKKLSEMKTQSCDQSQIQQTELTRFEKFYSTIKPIVGFMQKTNRANSTRSTAEPKIKKKQHIAQPELFNKEEILYHLKMLNQNNKLRREQKDEILANIKQDKKIVVTKDERVLDKFNNLKQDRNETSVILGNRTGRSFDCTLYQRSNDFRRRNEMQVALDNNLLIDKRIWYRQIRKQGNQCSQDLYSVDEKLNRNQESQVIPDILTNFNTHFTPQPINREIILLNQNENANLYQKKTIKNLQKRLSEVVPNSPILSLNHKQKIELQGINQFNKELEIVQQDKDDSMYQIIKNNEDKCEDEILVDNWNLKKKGQQYYPKICKYVL